MVVSASNRGAPGPLTLIASRTAWDRGNERCAWLGSGDQAKEALRQLLVEELVERRLLETLALRGLQPAELVFPYFCRRHFEAYPARTHLDELQIIENDRMRRVRDFHGGCRRAPRSLRARRELDVQAQVHLRLRRDSPRRE